MSDLIYFMAWSPPIVRVPVVFIAGAWFGVVDANDEVADIWIGTLDEWVIEASAMRGGRRRRRERKFPAHVVAIMDGDEDMARAIRARYYYLAGREDSHWYSLWPQLRRFIEQNSRPWDGEESARLGIERPKPIGGCRTDSVGLAGRLKLRRRSG
jgi:hypothetical protein